MKIPRYIFFIFTTLFAFSFAYGIDVTIPDASAPAEKSFTLAIASSDLTGAEIYSFDFKLIYDQSILVATSVSSSGTLISKWGSPTFNIGTGEVRVSAGGTDPLSGSGTLVKITFRVTQNASVGATSPLAFASFMFNEGTPQATVHNGTFTVTLDTAPPVITAGPQVSSVTSRSAVITWRTDEPASSVLDYGETSGYGQQLSDASLVTSHSYTLTGLRASTSYHFRVSNTDKLGNGPTTSEDQVFTTSDIIVSLPDVALDPGAELIVPVTTSELTEQGIQSVQMLIRFDADLLTATGIITDGTLSALWPAPSFSIGSGEISINLSGSSELIGSGTLIKIQFAIREGLRIGRKTDLRFENFLFNSGTPPATTRNGTFTVKDTRAPVITSGPEAVDVGSGSATIVWQTNEKATSLVEYGKTPEYGNIEKSAMRVDGHRITLSGLDPESTYHFRVSSTDSSGNGPTVSDDAIFTTQAGASLHVRVPDQSASVGSSIDVPVQVDDVTGQGISSYSAVIQYDRNLLTFESLDQSGSVASGWGNLAFDTIDGQVTVSNNGSTPLTGSGSLFTLHFRIKSDITNTTTSIRIPRFVFNSGFPQVSTASSTLTITGNPDQTLPQIVSGPIVDQVSTNTARVSWYTDEPADARVEYGSTTSYGQSLESASLALFHSFLLQNLQSNTEYHIRVQSRDAAGNGPRVSDDLSFTTLAQNGVNVSLPDASVAAGQNVQIKVQVGNLSGLQVYSAYLVLLYDENILSINSASTGGTLASAWGDPVFTITPGRVVIAMGGIKALSGSGTLVKLSATIRGDAPEGLRTPLILDRFTFNEGQPLSVVSNGSVIIKDDKEPALIKGPQPFALTPTTATILWATNEATISNIEYGTSVFYGGEKSKASLSTGHLMVLSGLEPNTLYHYRVSFTDAAGNGPVSSEDNTFVTPEKQVISLSLPDTSAGPGSTLSIPVLADHLTGLSVTSLQFDLIYDPTVMSFSRFEKVGTLLENWDDVSVVADGNRLVVSASGASSLVGGGRLLGLVFDISPSAVVGTRMALGIESVQLNGLSAEADLTSGSVLIKDSVPPQIIAGPYVNAVTSTSAEIFWQTDEPGNSLVEYGVSLSASETVTATDYTTNHQMTLTNLSPNTDYIFRVASADSFGNRSDFSTPGSFTTLPAQEITLSLPDTSGDPGQEVLLPISIGDVSGQNVTAISFSVLYDANILTFIQIVRENTLSAGWAEPGVQQTENTFTLHFSHMTPLEGSGVLVYVKMKIRADAPPGTISSLVFTAAQFNDGFPPALTRNGHLRVLDHQPPQIVTGPYATEITAASSVIVWYTDEVSNSLVEYGTTTNYGKSVTRDEFVIEHQILINGLQPSTEYHFRVGSTDSTGNGPTFSDDVDFTTTPEVGVHVTLVDTSATPGQVLLLPLTVDDVSSMAIRKISFDLLFNAEVVEIQDLVRQNSLTADWSTPVINVLPGQFSLSMSGTSDLVGSGALLFLKVKVLDRAQLGASSVLSFRRFVFNDGTPAALPRNGMISIIDAQAPVITSGPFVSNITSVAATVFWTTDELSSSIIQYGTSPDYGDESRDDRLTLDHSLTLSSLLPETTYHYRVGSVDSTGNGPSWSEDATFATLPIQGIYVALPDTTAGADADMLLPIKIQNADEYGITSLDFTIYYAPDVLDIAGINTSGTLVDAWNAPAISQAGQTFRVQISGSAPLSDAGILLYLSVHIHSGATIGVNVPLIFTTFKANNGSVAVVTKNGSVGIVDTVPPAFVTSPQVDRVLAHGVYLHWQSNEKSTARIEYGTSFSYGKVAEDLTLAEEHLFFLGNLLSSTTYHCRVGLVDSSGNGPVFSDDVMFTTASGDIVVSMPDTSAPVGSTLWVPVQVTDVSGQGIIRIRLKISYNTDFLKAVGSTTRGTIAESWGQPLFSDSRGQIQIDMTGPSALNGAGALILVGFNVSDLATPGETTPLAVEEIVFNDGDILPASISSGSIRVLQGEPGDAIRVTLPDTLVYADVDLNVPIRVSKVTDRNIYAYTFTLTFTDSVLTAQGVQRGNTLVSDWPEPNVEISENTINVSGSGTTALADSGSLLLLKFHSKPRLLSGRKSPLSFVTFSFNNGSPRSLTSGGSVTIKKRMDAIWGYVLDQDKKTPVDSATVSAVAAGSGARKTTLSDRSGFFQIAGLGQNSTYSLFAEKNGYVKSDVSPDVAPGSENIVLYLELKNGSIDGRVVNDFDEPVNGALIIADDGAGTFGSANSDSTGYFQIHNLARTSLYQLRISKYGYADKVLENVPANSTQTIRLAYNYGSITGTVTFADGSPAAQTTVILQNLEYLQEFDSTMTRTDGSYTMNNVIAGQYILSVNVPGYLSEPEQHNLNIGPGQAVTASFRLEQAVLHRLVLHGEQEVPNDEPSTFYYSALTASGRKMGIPEPRWALYPRGVGRVSKGIFYPNASFIGQAQIMIADVSTELSDTLKIEIYAPVGPETNREFFTSDSARIMVNAGSFTEQQKLKLDIVTLPPLKKNSKAAATLSDGYLIKPEGIELAAPVQLSLPHRADQGGNVLIGRWDKENSRWIPIKDSEQGQDANFVTATISSLGLFSLLAPSHALGIRRLRFTPNPFSPDVDTDGDGHEGLTISLQVSSLEARTPLVSITLYNMAGDLVRELVNREPFEKEKVNKIYWDGSTDDGRLARNGRYIVRTVVEDASGRKQRVDTVVLIR